ncbi:MAG: ATP-binding cassette domain-containing protein [Candidatus Eisenbacteria sp.]|nr:ATP-binding cassette domain-containing protein [Candidatus Eisenbacteria bacterium]
MKLYELENLIFTRSGRFTLEIDDFSLSRGEKVAIVGQNGAGKTTLLRLLAFLEEPSSFTRLMYNGCAYSAGKPDRNGLGFLKQKPYLFSGTVTQNLEYPLKVRGQPRSEVRRRVHSMLELLDILPLAEASARKLSGGEQKRLALGRVLISEPELLLLDEPVAHLDSPSRAIVERILAQARTTLLLTTHDLHFAHRIAHRVLNLKAGRISPTLPENILEGRREGNLLVTPGGLQIHLPPDMQLQGGQPLHNEFLNVDSLHAGVSQAGSHHAGVSQADSRHAGVPRADSHHAEAPHASSNTPCVDERETLTVMLDPRSLVLSLEPLSSSMRNHFRGRVCSIREQGNNVWLEVDCGETLTIIISQESYAELGINLNLEVVVSFKANAVEVL